MIREVVRENEVEVVTLSEVSKDKGYVMRGNKGDYILAKDTNGNFIWVKATPGSVTKPVHTYRTIEEAIDAKIDNYEVFEFDSVDFN